MLALLAFLAAVSTLIITLRFLEVLPWEEDLEFWGGKWVGVIFYDGLTLLGLAVVWG